MFAICEMDIDASPKEPRTSARKSANCRRMRRSSSVTRTEAVALIASSLNSTASARATRRSLAVSAPSIRRSAGCAGSPGPMARWASKAPLVCHWPTSTKLAASAIAAARSTEASSANWSSVPVAFAVANEESSSMSSTRGPAGPISATSRAANGACGLISRPSVAATSSARRKSPVRRAVSPSESTCACSAHVPPSMTRPSRSLSVLGSSFARGARSTEPPALRLPRGNAPSGCTESVPLNSARATGEAICNSLTVPPSALTSRSKLASTLPISGRSVPNGPPARTRLRTCTSPLAAAPVPLTSAVSRPSTRPATSTGSPSPLAIGDTSDRSNPETDASEDASRWSRLTTPSLATVADPVSFRRPPPSPAAASAS